MTKESLQNAGRDSGQQKGYHLWLLLGVIKCQWKSTVYAGESPLVVVLFAHMHSQVVIPCVHTWCLIVIITSSIYFQEEAAKFIGIID